MVEKDAYSDGSRNHISVSLQVNKSHPSMGGF